MGANRNGRNGQPETSNELIYMPAAPPAVVDSMQARGKRLNGRGAVPLPPSREVQFAALQEGGLVDLVRGPSGALSLLIFRNGTTTMADRFLDGGTTLVPPQIHHSLVDAVRWPTSFGTHSDNPRSLLDEMRSMLRNYVDLRELDYDLVAHFCLYTWFHELASVAPYLWLIGPYGSGKTTLLRLMSALCRRAVVGTDVTPAALYSVCDAVHPTLLLDELDLDGMARSRDLVRLLRGGSSQGAKVFRATKAYDVFGPRVIASRQEPPDAALASRALVVSTGPSQRSLPPLDEASLNEIAEQLQPRLLTFRLRNYNRARSPEFATRPQAYDEARSQRHPIGQ